GDPNDRYTLGPVASDVQWNKVQDLIRAGINEGATLVTGGVGRPDGLAKGYYVKPTLFADATNDMTIARTEIFGPVLCVIGYDTLEEAVDIANDTDYGLAAYVNGADMDKAREIGLQLRAGQVNFNGVMDYGAPFGGYKMSGNG